MDKSSIQTLIGESFAELSETIEDSPSCLKLITRDGFLLNMNETGLWMIEAESLEEVLGTNIYNIIEESHREKFIAFNHDVCNGNKRNLIFEIIGLNGTKRWLETYATPFTLKNGEIAHLAIVNDISEKISADGEQKLHLYNMSNLSPLGQFVGGVAHEINNPLAIISARVALLLNKAKKMNSKLNI